MRSRYAGCAGTIQKRVLGHGRGHRVRHHRRLDAGGDGLAEGRGKALCALAQRRGVGGRAARRRAVALGLEDRGADHARAKHRGRQRGIDGAQVLEQALGDADHRVLGREVRARAADQPGHGRAVDDVAFVAAGQHARHEGAQPVHHAHQVDLQCPPPVVEAAFPYRLQQRRRRDAGVVAQQVHRAVLGISRVGQRLDAGGAGHVHRHGHGHRALRLQWCQRALQRRGRDVGQHQLHAGGGEARGQRQADAAGRAGNHGHAALELLHAVSSSGSLPAMTPDARLLGHDARPCCNCAT